MEEGMRIDKWLWATRLFKTRSLASEACRTGKVKINDHQVKPSHVVKPGEIIAISLPPVIRTVLVTALTNNRVAAKLVPGLLDDLTPQSEYDKLKRKQDLDFEFRQRGLGRPTKRERREIEYLKYYLDE